MANNLHLAQNHAFQLARTLMVCVTVFRSEFGYGVLPSDEFDGDEATIIAEFDPFA